MKIKKLNIETPNADRQRRFYHEVLGLPVTRFGTKNFEVRVGYSLLHFQHNEDATPYHIAFHIPAAIENRALDWLQERVEILTMEVGQGKKAKKIIDFSNWNAKSIYFYDEDKNILELISRKHLWHTDSNEFSAAHFLGLAEIGLATTNVKSAFRVLQQNFDLQQYDGDVEKFCPIGDDQGLLITIDRNKKEWFPTNDKACASAFTIQFQQLGKSNGFTFKNNTITSI